MDIPTLCRAGVCGTCRTKVDGEVECDAGSDADRANGYVLACVSTVRGRCVVDA